MAEHAAENRGVGSSILPLATPSRLTAVLTPAIDRDLIKELKDAEDAGSSRRARVSRSCGRARRDSMPNGVPMSWLRTSYDHLPLFIESASGARLRDVDGHEYADFNIADMSMFTGYGPAPVVEAVSAAGRAGVAVPAADRGLDLGREELAPRYGLPQWQFTLAATSANTEVIRIARSMTGREKVLFFDGKYHGHFDDALVELEDGRLVPEEDGLPHDVTERTLVVPFNDLDARAALASAATSPS